jgi:hypothetical protein
VNALTVFQLESWKSIKELAYVCNKCTNFTMLLRPIANQIYTGSITEIYNVSRNSVGKLTFITQGKRLNNNYSVSDIRTR